MEKRTFPIPSKESLEAIIFDLDGTLIHTTPEYRYGLLGKILKELGVKKWSENHIDEFWFGHDRSRTVSSRFGLNPKKFWALYDKRESISLRKKEVRLYEDVHFVKRIKNRGLKTGIVTGSPRDVAEMEIDLIGKDLFDAVVIARDSEGVKGKPDPDGLNLCLDMLGVSKKRALYVGNGKEDVLAARKAGIFDVLIDRGEYRIPDASFMIKTLFELERFLK